MALRMQYGTERPSVLVITSFVGQLCWESSAQVSVPSCLSHERTCESKLELCQRKHGTKPGGLL